jgi:hypothetical protein
MAMHAMRRTEQADSIMVGTPAPPVVCVDSGTMLLNPLVCAGGVNLM